MGRFAKGEVVIIPFPFSDLSNNKIRPALVITDLNGADIILCQITSRKKDNDAILLNNHDFSRGCLNKKSYVRPNRIFTADKSVIIKSVGQVSKTKVHEIVKKLIKIINR